LNFPVADHSELVVPCAIRARQYIRVVDWRSSAGVKLVLPPAFSAMPVPLAATGENPVLSAIWNS
jgi:hypothetical protein